MMFDLGKGSNKKSIRIGKNMIRKERFASDAEADALQKAS